MGDYRVDLDIFAGPLDLLLYLVRKNEVDIYDISIAGITDQYLRYIEVLKSLDIDLAGDFLVMAATLMQIKSAMLLPKAEVGELEADDLTDPRTELIRQLLEYKKFKDAANLLADATDEQKMRFARPDSIIKLLKSDNEPEIDLDQANIWDLLDAFDSIMKSVGTGPEINHITDDTPIDLYQIEILHQLQSEGPMSLERIFESKGGRFVMIGLFLALLELIREELVWAKQQGALGSIYLRSLTEEPAEQAVQKAIFVSEAEVSSSQPPQSRQQTEPAIPIDELPAKTKSEVPVENLQQKQPSIPVAELPPKNKRQALPDEDEQKIKPAEDHKQQTTN